MGLMHRDVNATYLKGARTYKSEQTTDITYEQGDAFAGSVCNQPIVFPPADFDALVETVNSPKGPNEKLSEGAEWFKQNGF